MQEIIRFIKNKKIIVMELEKAEAIIDMINAKNSVDTKVFAKHFQKKFLKNEKERFQKSFRKCFI